MALQTGRLAAARFAARQAHALHRTPFSEALLDYVAWYEQRDSSHISMSADNGARQSSNGNDEDRHSDPS